jgi:hypothetical protein
VKVFQILLCGRGWESVSWVRGESERREERDERSKVGGSSRSSRRVRAKLGLPDGSLVT